MLVMLMPMARGKWRTQPGRRRVAGHWLWLGRKEARQHDSLQKSRRMN